MAARGAGGLQEVRDGFKVPLLSHRGALLYIPYTLPRILLVSASDGEPAVLSPLHPSDHLWEGGLGGLVEGTRAGTGTVP